MSIRRGYYEEYTLEELKNFLPQNRETMEMNKPLKTIEDSIVDDDRFSAKKWTEAYKFASYYFDNPNIHDRFRFQNKLRLHFSKLFTKTAQPTELPDMRSRTHLVSWVCKKHNEFLEKENGNFQVDCNAEKLLKTYGPNYDNVKNIIGEYDFYY
jgi:hypothetical protein